MRWMSQEKCCKNDTKEMMCSLRQAQGAKTTIPPPELVEGGDF